MPWSVERAYGGGEEDEQVLVEVRWRELLSCQECMPSNCFIMERKKEAEEHKRSDSSCHTTTETYPVLDYNTFGCAKRRSTACHLTHTVIRFFVLLLKASHLQHKICQTQNSSHHCCDAQVRFKSRSLISSWYYPIGNDRAIYRINEFHQRLTTRSHTWKCVKHYGQ